MKNNLSNIKKSKYYLDKNECIAIPTETVYGLAANAYSDTATAKVFKLKKRPKKNPLIVHYNSLKMLKQDCEINDLFNKLYKKFCPGPLTFILKKNKSSKIVSSATANLRTIAIRFPNNRKIRAILKLSLIHI